MPHSLLWVLGGALGHCMGVTARLRCLCLRHLCPGVPQTLLRTQRSLLSLLGPRPRPRGGQSRQHHGAWGTAGRASVSTVPLPVPCR